MSLLAILAMLIIVALPSAFSWLDSAARPVSTVIQVDSVAVYPAEVPSSKVSGEVTRLRNCVFHRVEWYLGDEAGRHVLVPSRFLDPPQTREEGRFYLQGVIVELPPEEIIRNSFAYAVHECSWFVLSWTVRSLFYSSAIQAVQKQGTVDRSDEDRRSPAGYGAFSRNQLIRPLIDNRSAARVVSTSR